MSETPHFGEYFYMEQICLAGTQKSGLRSRTLYRVAAIGIATFITQASPGGAASSWGVECLTTDSANNSYCVTSLSDDIPSDSAAWTLRKSVEDANTRAAASATIGFQDALFGIKRNGAGEVVNNSQTAITESTNPTNEGKIVLGSTLEIKTNIVITAPTDKDGATLLTIERGNAIPSGVPLISVNPTADSAADPASPSIGPAANQATTEVNIENVTIDSRSNSALTSDASGNLSQPGVAIQVKTTIANSETGDATVTPTVVLVNTVIKNTVSESGGAAINTPGNVQVESSTLVGNVAITPSGGAPTDGGAIKAGGTVTVVSSALNDNSATGNGGAISATTVIVTNAADLSNSQLNGNTAGGSGGAIHASEDVSVTSNSLLTDNSATGSGGAVHAGGNVSVSDSTLTDNTATTGSGGAISATGATSTVEIINSGLGNNTASGNGGAISASGTTGEVSVNNSSLGNNTASGDGGAIAAGGAVTVSSNSVLVFNSSTSGNGGAISAGGDVTIVNSGLSSNTASGNGGAISATGATIAVEVTNSGLAGNTAGGSGGAIAVTGTTSAVEVTNSVLAFNTASTGNGGSISSTGSTSTVSITNTGLGYNTAGGDGGAIAASGANSTVLIKDTSIAENIAGNNGGGISSGGEVAIGSNSSTPVNTSTTGNVESALASAASSTTSDSAFSASTSITLTLGSNVYSTSAGQGNSGSSDSATNPSGSIMFKNTAASGNGGAVSAQGEVTVTSGSHIYANTASQDGGAISSQSAVEISNSAVSGNTATAGDGGAISTLATVSISETSTVSSNTAEESGGGISAAGQVTVSASTLNSNIATTGDGGAISSGNTVTVSNSTLHENEAPAGYGGAVFSTEKVITSSTTSFDGNSAEYGGAIAAAISVNITDTKFIDNSASEYGGAIDIGDDSTDKSSIIDSTFEENSSSETGGAIDGHIGKLVINNSDFEGNTASESGGAIWHQGDLDVIDSMFAGNIASSDSDVVQEARIDCDASSDTDDIDSIYRIECMNDSFMFSDFPFIASQGGAIYVGAVLESVESPRNLKASIDNSDFTQNSAQGDGGAIYFLGLLQILGSRFVENLALPGTTLSDEYQGSGGAVYGDNVEIISSEFEGNSAIYDGGAVNVNGQILVSDSSFQSNSSLFGNGGAIYVVGTLRVSTSTFGSTPELNLNYNPIIGYNQNPDYSPDLNIENPSFNPYVEAPNPAYNPIGMVTNPTYNVGVSEFIANPNVNTDVPRLIRNGDCPSGSTIYDGQDFGNGPIYGCEYTINNGDGSISFGLLPLYVDNPEYDGREFLDNPLYDDRRFVSGLLNPDLPENNTEFISVLANPDLPNDEEEYIPNPNQDTREELPQLMFNDSQQDDYKYNYGGNSSGGDGGAIYVEGEATINVSSFAGNTSDSDGGAIYSEGALQIKDTSFNRNWAEDDGGAINSTPGNGDLFIARTSFIENVSMDDGGAIDISTGTLEHYDDVILSSLFRDNESFGSGGAVDSGYVVLILNTFEDNKSLEGQSLNLSGGYLSGNVLIGPAGGQDLCFVTGSLIAANNFGTDESCFKSSNYLLTREKITAEGALHTLPEGYETTLLGELKDKEEFFLQLPSESNLDGVLAPLGAFITNELNKDFKSEIRDSTVSWTAGHLQGIFPDLTNEPEGDNSVGDNEIVQSKDKEKDALEKNSESKDQVVVNQPGSTNLDSPVLIFEPTLSTEELARISQLRAEQLAAELLRQKEAERIAAENLAKIKAAKLARDKARALAAEKRRAQLAALKAKIAATQARGDVLKKKSSWINLMKNSPNSNQAKKLVKIPSK